jgi:quinol monooxygenase YgiN
MTVIVTALFTPKEGAFDSVVAALSPAIAEVHQEPGCLLYAIHESPDGRVLMIEKWESAELLDAHGDGDPVKRLNASLSGLLEKPVEVQRHMPIPAGDRQQGTL